MHDVNMAVHVRLQSCVQSPVAHMGRDAFGKGRIIRIYGNAQAWDHGLRNYLGAPSIATSAFTESSGDQVCLSILTEDC